DAGLRYSAEIELGHEDWDFALQLAARGVIGEPSREPFFLYRKHGFTRSDLVEYMRLPFWKEIQDRHPELYGTRDHVGAWGAHSGPALAIKRRWTPAISILCLGPIEMDSAVGRCLLRGLEAQSCGDFEVIAECTRLPASSTLAIRRIPPGLAETTPQ